VVRTGQTADRLRSLTLGIGRLDDWCDEATFTDWEQSDPSLPDWQTGYDRLIADGQVASLTHASDAHQTRAFPAPVTAS
jgi:hypothetical protein